jgi:hypothetical protein
MERFLGSHVFLSRVFLMFTEPWPSGTHQYWQQSARETTSEASIGVLHGFDMVLA